MEVYIRFIVECETRWGDSLYIVGNVAELGWWNVTFGERRQMNWWPNKKIA